MSIKTALIGASLLLRLPCKSNRHRRSLHRSSRPALLERRAFQLGPGDHHRARRPHRIKVLGECSTDHQFDGNEELRLNVVMSRRNSENESRPLAWSSIGASSTRSRTISKPNAICHAIVFHLYGGQDEHGHGVAFDRDVQVVCESGELVGRVARGANGDH